MKYALWSHRNTENLGDEIQSLAARRFLPRIDRYVDRDFAIDEQEPDEPHAIILNGWFTHSPENWPPPDWLVPLPVSMHLVDPGIPVGMARTAAADFVFSDELVAYLRHWAPIGARDLSTLRQLERADVPAYFSGCMTLTLERAPGVEHSEAVLLVDVPVEIVEKVSASTDREVRVLTHRDVTTQAVSARLELAEELLGHYQRAHCVVTTRLHAALPCLAFDTPCLFLRPESDTERLPGLEELLHSLRIGDVLEGGVHLDVENPRPNRLDYLRVRNVLTETVSNFVHRVDAGTMLKPAGISDRQRALTLRSVLSETARERDELRARVTLLQRQLNDALPAPGGGGSPPPRIRRIVGWSVHQLGSALGLLRRNRSRTDS